MATPEANFIGSSIKIQSMALNEAEDTVYVVTNQGQMLKASINIADYARHPVETKFSYVSGQFHKA